MPILENEMLQLGKCAKHNSKMFLLNRKVSKLSFGNIKSDWKFWNTPPLYKSNFQIQDETKSVKQKICRIMFRYYPEFVIHEKSPLIC